MTHNGFGFAFGFVVGASPVFNLIPVFKVLSEHVPVGISHTYEFRSSHICLSHGIPAYVHVCCHSVIWKKKKENKYYSKGGTFKNSIQNRQICRSHKGIWKKVKAYSIRKDNKTRILLKGRKMEHVTATYAIPWIPKFLIFFHGDILSFDVIVISGNKMKRIRHEFRGGSLNLAFPQV